MKENHKLPHDATPDVHEFHSPPETVEDILNCWGTYNIQATTKTENLFPLIGPGLPKKWKNKEITKDDLEKNS